MFFWIKKKFQPNPPKTLLMNYYFTLSDSFFEMINIVCELIQGIWLIFDGSMELPSFTFAHDEIAIYGNVTENSKY